MINAIVYTTNTGSSAAYAEMLGEKTGLPVYEWSEARASLDAGSQIIYIGWLMAGTVVNLKKAQKTYAVRSVCAVGLTASEEMVQNVRARNKLPADMPLFLAQGAYDSKKLHGMYRFAMSIVGSILDKKISAIPNRNAEEERILTMLRDGGSGVHEDYLAPLLAWYHECKHSD